MSAIVQDSPKDVTPSELLDYDAIEAPQFLDFQTLPVDEEDPALRFFEQNQEQEISISEELEKLHIGDDTEESFDKTGVELSIEEEVNSEEGWADIVVQHVTAEGTAETFGIDLNHEEARAEITVETSGTSMENSYRLFRETSSVEAEEENASVETEVKNSSVVSTKIENNLVQAEAEERASVKKNKEAIPVDESEISIAIDAVEDSLAKEGVNANLGETGLRAAGELRLEFNTEETGPQVDAETEAGIKIKSVEVAALYVMEPVPIQEDSEMETRGADHGRHFEEQEKRKMVPRTPSAEASGIPVLKKADKVTIPKPFHFQQIRLRSHAAGEKQESFKFRARPAPVKVLHGAVTGLKEKPEVRSTIPVTPHFASDARILERHRKAEATQGRRLFSGTNENAEPEPSTSAVVGGQTEAALARRARQSMRSDPSPISRGRRRSASPAIVIQHKAPTIAQPFSFEERERERKRLKDEKVKKMEDDEQRRREFHANPLPSFKPSLPKKIEIPPTKPEPFHLKVEERGVKHQEELRKKLEEEERMRELNAAFHANPSNVIFQEPFVPEESHKPLTAPMEIELNSDRRAQERELFDWKTKQKENELERRRKQEEADRAAAEARTIQEIRKKTVHKTQPIKGQRAFELKLSSKPLTAPMSPAFAPLPSQRRILHQNQNNQQQ